MTITRSHSMQQQHAHQACPRCRHESVLDNANDQPIVPVYCVPACVIDRSIGGETYWEVRP